MQNVVYHFRFADGHSASISALPEPQSEPAALPDWTRLEHRQCKNCPLSPEHTPHCPMAVQFVKLVDNFGTLPSYTEVEVEVETPERRVLKSTTLQRGIGSLMGLLAASSACPHTTFLKPMAHFHLPFSNEDETIFRVASMYLLAQYLRGPQDGPPDWELAHLKDHYEQLQTVNAAMAVRLRGVGKEDGTINALILLDLLAKALPYSIDEALDEVRGLFA
jgi:hypothetical protein